MLAAAAFPVSTAWAVQKLKGDAEVGLFPQVLKVGPVLPQWFQAPLSVAGHVDAMGRLAMPGHSNETNAVPGIQFPASSCHPFLRSTGLKSPLQDSVRVNAVQI